MPGTHLIRSRSASFSRPYLNVFASTAALLSFCFAAGAQAPHTPTAAEQQRVEGLLRNMTLQQKIDYIGGTGFAVRGMPELGIPALEMSDGPYGTRSNVGLPATAYVAGVGLAASWDRELASRVGAGIARDARARGVHFMLGPGVNIYRSPRNGRNFEYFGEDPFLSGQMAAGYIVGMQQQGVSATVKHFLGNNSEFLRHDSDSEIPERAAREIYLPAFETAVKQGHVSAVMDSYNVIDGKHATENPYLNIDILRKEWGFQGILMSDWGATYNGVGAANGGLDLEMPTGNFMNNAVLGPAVASGKVAETTIDEKVRHILLTAASYGWLDRDQRDGSISFLDSANKAAALDSARESAVLLKNDGALLPLKKSQIKKILVVGPDAYPAVPVGGGSAGVVPFHAVSGLEGIADKLGSGASVLYDRGVPPLSMLSEATQMTTAPHGGQPGVTVDTFGNADLQGAVIDTGTVPHLNLDVLHIRELLLEHRRDAMEMAATMPPTPISHRFTGYFHALSAGKYIVVLEGPGEGSGNRVLVDDKPVIDNWKLVRAFQPHVSVDFAPGPHKIVVEQWQENPAGSRLNFAIVAEDTIVNPRAVELAKGADAVVVEAGFSPESESEGGDRTFTLPYGQAALIRAMTAANPKTVVTVTSGGSVDLENWLDRVPALLETWYAGQEGGHALAEILFGEVNPSGHLPMTFERHAEDNPTYANYYTEGDTRRIDYKEGIFVGYRGYERNHVQPLFPFGYGLSYTTFQFANLRVEPSGTDGATASFEVTNTGNRKGAEVAQLYVTENHAKVERPAHELKGFERVELAPGETRHITVPLDARAFSYYDVGTKKWAIGSNRFTIAVGDSVASLPLTAQVTLRRGAK